MARYKCTKCGTESPHKNPCFLCGNKEKKEAKGPDFRNEKKDKKRKKIERHRKTS